MTTKLPTIKELIESGAHFGHLRARTHPKAKNFAFEVRDQIVLIDLDKTLDKLNQAADYCKQVAAAGQTILLVGTKKQVQELVKAKAMEADISYVNKRWLAGTLTNFEEILKNIKKMERFEAQLQDSDSGTKRERGKLQENIDKLHGLFDGIRDMAKLPDVLLIVDAAAEKIAAQEARRLSIPIVAIIDTNVDPSKIDYPVPANDDSKKTVEILLNYLVQAIIEGKKRVKNNVN